MRTSIWLVGMILAGVAAGCDSLASSSKDRIAIDEWLVNSYGDDAIRNALIAQHTLYAYHFVTNDSQLNELGQHDLTVLAAHFKEHPGQLSLRRGDAEETLYHSRLRTVVQALRKAGVDSDRMQIGEGLPGGEGMASDNVVTILVRELRQGQTRTSYSDTSSGRATPSPGMEAK